MSDTTTTNLALTLMEAGSHENTWGDVTNDNLQQVEDKLTAETEIATTGGTTTLSDTEEYANVIDVAGALASNATLVFHGRKGTWVIVNETTGTGKTLTCKVTGQTGVAIAQGTSQIVRCDGTDVRAVTSVSSSLSSDLDANGHNIKFSTSTGFIDNNGHGLLTFGVAASAVNYLTVYNAATGNSPGIQSVGTNSDIDIGVIAKGLGRVIITSDIVCYTDGAYSLGEPTHPWKSLYLKSGGIVDFNNGDVTITHSANALAFAGASGNYFFDTAVFAQGAQLANLGLEDQTVAGGAGVTSKSLGTVSSGTLTLDMGDRPLQHYTNNGAHTLAPGAVTGSCVLDITNGASAGATTTSGFTKVGGDSLDTTNAHKFRCVVVVGNAGSSLTAIAMQ